MKPAFSSLPPGTAGPRVWAVGALVRAVADALEARFNPVAVRGEVSAFTRASSGHCYFALKDGAGQLRCAMFRSAAALLGFAPRDGDQVEVRGRLAVYEPRGDLQLIVESMRRAGQGELFERFLQLKAKLDAEGLFAPERKRAAPAMPRGIGLVTSPQAAALHDVLTALARRAPHVPVWFAPAAVQGGEAPAQLVAALQKLYRAAQRGQLPIDLIVLVRGGGLIEDLWAFNDEALVRAIALSPVPVIAGVGHETDFTLADFAADVRAPTPTAAAELAAAPREDAIERLRTQQTHLERTLTRRLEREAQRLDALTARLPSPAAQAAVERQRLVALAARLAHALRLRTQAERAVTDQRALRWSRATQTPLARHQAQLARLVERLPAAAHALQARRREHLQRLELRLSALAPERVLARGYAWLEDTSGQPVTRATQARPGQAIAARLADGRIGMRVEQVFPAAASKDDPPPLS
ncbi:MAG: exodeoxyribonuclease VII large subunit [Burkholderiaceae bacterium]|jgi:exodeoxyribonuclease VII large subunit|nr:exodeoxyribonuclease VII large subunit [Burkholderiaceae bacterium]